jgi:ABC-type sugar transport system permease subunit
MYNYAFRMNANDSYSYGSAISNVIVSLSVVLILISNFVAKKTGSGEAT